MPCRSCSYSPCKHNKPIYWGARAKAEEAKLFEPYLIDEVGDWYHIDCWLAHRADIVISLTPRGDCRNAKFNEWKRAIYRALT